MRYLIEKGSIFCGLFLWKQWTVPLDMTEMLLVLCWCILSFSDDWVNKTWLQYSCLFLQLGMFLIHPTLIFLLPLFLMQLMKRNQFAGIAALSLSFLHWEGWIFLIGILSLYLTYRTLQESAQQTILESQLDNLQQEAFHLYEKQQLLQFEHEKNIELTKLAERNRISHELHDEIGHTISTTIMQLEALQVVSTDDFTTKQLEKLSTHLQSGMDRIRHTLHGMYEDTFVLEEKIQELFSPIPQNASIDFQYHMPSTVPLGMRFDMVALIKEIVTNFAKHSTTKTMHLYIMEHPHLYTIDYKDTSPVPNPIQSNGIGILAINEIVQKNHGQLTIDTHDGYHLFIRIPKEQENSYDTHITH